MGDAKVYLSVPYAKKDAAKGCGARWDPEVRRWFVPAGADLFAVAEWLPEEPLPTEGSLRLAVLLLPRQCYACQGSITCVIGLRLPPQYGWIGTASIDIVAYLAIDDCGLALEPRIGRELRARLRIGPMEYRRTRLRPEGYAANTCWHCGATQGSFPLGEDLDTFLAGDRSRVKELWRDGVEVEVDATFLRGFADDDGPPDPERGQDWQAPPPGGGA